jgi:parvulin-like peptidyl-prolyl isomerase
MNILSAVGLLTIVVLAGCGPSEDDVVAQVGTYSITASTLSRFVEKLPDGLRVQETGDAARRRYLQDLIDRRLMLIEAQSRGLDTTQAVLTAVNAALDSRARDRYRSRKMTSTEELAPEEGRRYFDSEGYNRERKLTAILLENRAQAKAALAELKAGKAFEDIARARSLDKAAAVKGGELGWVGRDMAVKLYIPLEIFIDLPTGQVSEPLTAGKSWHLVRFTEERPATYEKYRLLIASRLHAEHTKQRAEEHFEKLEASFKIQLRTDGLKELVAAYHQRTPEVLADSPTPLYLYDQGEINVGQVQQILKPMKEARALANLDPTKAVIVLQKYVLRPFLLAEAARRAGIYNEPDLTHFAADYREDVVLETLREIAVFQKITLSEEEVRQYYDEHPELFFHQGSTWIEELLLPTKEAAQDLKEQLEAGARFEEFASLSLRPGAVKSKAEFHFHPLEKIRYPRLIPAILQAPQGQLVGPLELEAGFSVFRVSKQEEGAVESFATARRRAQGLRRRQHEQDMFHSLMKTLRTRYADQTEIFETRLRSALPDSLVGIE